jgi:YesN/AraC family two-component response regulator
LREEGGERRSEELGEMIRQMSMVLPKVRIILLSGYSNKEYMMEAIKLDVSDYLLKPAGTEQVLRAVLRQRDEILLERQREQQNIQMEYLINENIDILKEHFLEELLDGDVSAGQVQQKADFFRIKLPGPKYALFTVVPKQSNTWEIIQIISSRLEQYFPVLVIRKDAAIVTILNVAINLPQEEIMSLTRQLEGLTDSMARPCYGESCEPELLHMLYTVCREMIERSIWFNGSYITARMDVRFDPPPKQELMLFERNIIQSVRTGNFTMMLKEIDALFLLMEKKKPTNKCFQDILLGIARSIQMFSENNELYAQLEELFNGSYTPDSIKKTIISGLHNDYSQYGSQIRNVLNFIMKHCDQELLLTNVAATFYISPSYLTRLLKSKTGRGFNDWLHIIRIEKAKALLEKSDLRHYEIAEQVGYSSYKIFSEYFGRIVGCSARNYRKNILDP